VLSDLNRCYFKILTITSEWVPISMQARLPNLASDACDLISQLMIYDPNKRYT